MDEKSLRSLIEHGGVKQLRIIADGALFHVDVVTTRKGQITAMTSKGTVKTWGHPGCNSKVGSITGDWQGPAGCYWVASRATGNADLMFKSFVNHISEVRRRRADLKTTGGSFNFSRMLEDAQKERDRLSEHPPPCGSVIRYVPECIYEETHAEFLFRSADVEQNLEEALQENPHLSNGDEGAILNWIQGSNDC